MPLSEATPEWWTIFDYSEWLDQQGILHDDKDDGRSHEQLVDEFLAQRDTLDSD